MDSVLIARYHGNDVAGDFDAAHLGYPPDIRIPVSCRVGKICFSLKVHFVILIFGVIKQNQPEVGSDMLLVSDHFSLL